MKTVCKFFNFIFFIIFSNIVLSQTQIPLYKMVMNSDIVLIIEAKDFKYIIEKKNEYYTENWIKFESTFSILKNKFNQKIENIQFRIETDNNDFYQNINGGDCSGVANILEKGKKYYNIFFLKRKEKKYFVIAHLWNNISVKELPFFEKNIKQIESISKEKDFKIKYIKIAEWFKVSNENHTNEYIIETPFTDELHDFFSTTIQK